MTRDRHTRFVFGIAILVGVMVGVGLSVFMSPKDGSFESCVARKMNWQPKIYLPNVRRLCAKQHGHRLSILV
jgi:hypothetical protein